MHTVYPLVWLIVVLAGAQAWKVLGDITGVKSTSGFCSAAMIVDGMSYLLTFGGRVSPSNTLSNTLSITNISNNATTVVFSPFTAPTPREYSCCYTNSSMFYLFGGMFQNQDITSQLWSFNLKSMSWSQINLIGSSGYPRAHCSLMIKEDGLVVVGTGSGSNILQINLTTHIIQ